MRFPQAILFERGDAGTRSFEAMLRDAGFRVRTLQPADAIDAGLLVAPTDLVLLDVDRLDAAALALAGQLRARSTAPILFVAEHSDATSRIAALDMGIDDILPRALGARELMARIRAILRRGAIDAGGPRRSGHLVRFDGWRANIRMRELVSPAAKPVDLTTAEFELLSALIENPRRTMTRDQLLLLAPTCGGGTTGRAIDVLVSRLRSKMGRGGGVSPIVTVRGLGYRLEADVEAGQPAGAA